MIKMIFLSFKGVCVCIILSDFLLGLSNNHQCSLRSSFASALPQSHAPWTQYPRSLSGIQRSQHFLVLHVLISSLLFINYFIFAPSLYFWFIHSHDIYAFVCEVLNCVDTVIAKSVVVILDCLVLTQLLP